MSKRKDIATTRAAAANQSADADVAFSSAITPVHSLPLGEALDVLRSVLTKNEHAALTGPEMPTAVRTYGDLLEALRTGDLASVPGVDVDRLSGVLGI